MARTRPKKKSKASGPKRAPVRTPEAKPVTTPLQKLLLAVFGVALLVVVLAATEGVLALLDVGAAERYADPFVGFEPGRDLFVREGDVYTTSPAKLTFFNPQSFPAKKGDDTYRIFALGGSTTAGRPYDHRVAFPHWLELYLRETDPSRSWEVVNAGAISYASYRVVVLMQELVRYEPDLFVVYTGHNEFLEERSYPELAGEDPSRRRLRAWLTGLRTATLARRLLDRLRPAPEEEETPRTLLESEVRTKLEGWTGLDTYHRDDALRHGVAAHFAFNLRQMVEIARDHGADVVFVAPASNLKDFSPFKSEDPEDLSAEVRFRLGQTHFARGDVEAARRAFIEAKDLDVAPLRALEAFVDEVRAVAAETSSALVDLPRILEAQNVERFGHPILGNEVFLDHVHPDVPVHSLIAERLLDVLVERGIARRGAGGSPERLAALYDQKMSEVDEVYYAERDLNLAKVLGWAGKLAEAEPPLQRAAKVLTDDFELHLNLGVLYQKTGRLEPSLEELRRAVELEPRAPEAHFNLGVTLGFLGRLDEATAALDEAVRLQPDYPEAFYNLAVLEIRRGNPEAGLAALDRVQELRPGSAETQRERGRAWFEIGRLESRRGRDDAAEAAYQKTLELDPQNAEALNNLALVHARRGELELARQELEKALAWRPDYAEAHFNLGVVLDQLGRRQDAARAVARALELDPENARFRQAMTLLQQEE